MHSYNTPPPFRFSTQQRPPPPRSSVARTPKFLFNTQSSSSVNQFASTPRFVLSQPSGSRNSVGDDIKASDDEPSSSFSPAPRKQKREPCIADESEVTDDLEGGRGKEETLYSVADESDRITPEADNEAAGDTGDSDIDAEFEILFPATPSRHKRRRISPSTPPQQVQHRAVEGDHISSASDVSKPPSPDGASDLASPEHQAPHEHFNSNTYGRPSTPKPSTIISKQPHQSSNRPRFVFPLNTPFHASQELRDDAVSPTISSTAPAPSTSRPWKSKPHFIFPRPPSPSHEDLNPEPPPIPLPEPFSPSRYHNRRDGQSQGNGMNFVGGGMAVETRGWILEMAAKVQQQHQLRETTRKRNLQEKQDSDAESAKYMLTTEVSSVRCDYENELEDGPGFVRVRDRGGVQTPVTLVQPHHTDEGNSENRQEPAVDDLSRNVLLLGPPSIPNPSATQITTENCVLDHPKIQKGSSIGVKKGLVWEIKIGCHNNPANEHDEDQESNANSDRKSKEEMGILKARRTSKKGSANGKWLVGVEWDILR